MSTFRMLATIAAFWTGVLLGSPAAPPQEPLPRVVDAKIMEARLVKKVDPIYPEPALRARMSGTVRLQVVINELGEVAGAKVIGGGGPLLQPAALKAVKQWRYSPYVDERGHAIPVTTKVNVTFHLLKQFPEEKLDLDLNHYLKAKTYS